jgi:hypothetical protein
MTLGNFFSGSGTWELAAEICGIEPIWESEIEYRIPCGSSEDETEEEE